MKQLLLTPLLFLFILTGCEKDHPKPGSAPRAFAGKDIYVALPADSATLKGVAKDDPFDKLKVSWKKISGPASYVIEKPGSFQTRVRNLVKGTYEFEFTVTDPGGLKGMDTVSLELYDPRIPGSNELVFKNLTWIFPWYATIEVENYISYPVPKKVFIQRGSNPTWIEVSDGSNSSNSNPYEYFITTGQHNTGMYSYGSLYICYYGNDTDDRPQVKIQF